MFLHGFSHFQGGLNMSYKQNRTLKVYEQSGYKYKTIPTIMLKGQWLAELNFQIGDNISVICEEWKLVITKTELQLNN